MEMEWTRWQPHSPDAHNPEKLFDFINHNPGCNIGDAREKMTFGRSAFDTAKKELIRENKIHECQFGGRKYLFPYSPEINTWAHQYLILSDQHLAKLYCIVEFLGIPKKSDVVSWADSIGWKKHKTVRRLFELEGSGLLEPVCMVGDPNCLRYRALPVHEAVEALLTPCIDDLIEREKDDG